MSFNDWMNNKVKKLDWLDVGLVKLSVFFFTLMLVAIWPEIAKLHWYWFLVLFILAALRPLIRAYSKKK